jgi:hypothetical protein
MRSSACDAATRRCVRNALCWIAFPLAPALGSIGSDPDRSASFVDFSATMAGPDFSRPSSSATAPHLPDAIRRRVNAPDGRETSWFPSKEFAHMPGSQTSPGRRSARVCALPRVAFRRHKDVGAQNDIPFAARWLAYAHPYRRFACALADANARLGADAVRYSFIVSDFHRLLPAGLPAH